MAAGNVVVGDRLGLYRALAQGPAGASELAERTDTDPRYVEEWLRGQAAGGYVTYDASTATYSLTEEQAFALTDPDGPIFLPGAFELAVGALKAAGPRSWTRSAPARASAGTSTTTWSSPAASGSSSRATWRTSCRSGCRPSTASSRSSRTAHASPTSAAGTARRPCCSREAYPKSTFDGSDYHQGSIDQARKRAAEAGVTDRVTFEVASAQTFEGHGYDLAATFDCLHDMGDPLGAARHIRASLAPDGTWLIVEPAASDNAGGQLQPRRPRLLQLLDVPLRAQRHVADRRLRARCAGR